MTWFTEMWRVLLCAWYGHNDVLQYDERRISLVCHSCGRNTAGWEVQGWRKQA